MLIYIFLSGREERKSILLKGWKLLEYSSVGVNAVVVDLLMYVRMFLKHVYTAN